MVTDFPEVLRDAGLTLRRYRSTDASAVLEAVLESGTDLSRWETWAHPAFTLRDAEQYVGWWVSAWKDGTARYFAITEPHERYLGSCGLSAIDRGHGCAGLGFWVRSEATGRGVATSAARMVIGFGFEHLGLRRVEMMAGVENTASRRVAAKVGAVEEGILRGRFLLGGVPHDAVLAAVIKEE